MNDADVIVVGSGASAVLAADRLLDAGRRVLMLDVGDVDVRYASSIPEQSYTSARRADAKHYEYALGSEYEGIDLGKTGPLAQTTPPRQHVFRRAAQFLRTAGEGFSASESLARGGLAEAWGAVSFPFTAVELRRAGLDAAALAPHYEAVAQRIGVSGENDDLLPWRGPLDALQATLPADPNAAAMLARYGRKRASMMQQGIRVGRPLLAVLSRALGVRKANPLLGLDFWSNPGGSVFRPSLMLEQLRQHPQMDYRSDIFVTRFVESEDGVVVEGTELAGGARMTFRARRLLLTAGALSTTRIVLRSTNAYDVPVPLVCNEHAYIPSVRIAGLGAAPPDQAHALAQLTAMYDPTGDQEHLAQAQAYSFTGLPLTKLVRESPLAYKQSTEIFRTLATSFVILVVQHEDLPTPQKHCVLRRGSSPFEDVLEIAYALSASESAQQHHAERRFSGMLRGLGCFPIKVVRPGAGSSVHYGGSLPFRPDGKPLTLGQDGMLAGARRVYVGDGAGLSYLPAKGLTLTLMANARRVAEHIIRHDT